VGVKPPPNWGRPSGWSATPTRGTRILFQTGLYLSRASPVQSSNEPVEDRTTPFCGFAYSVLAAKDGIGKVPGPA